MTPLSNTIDVIIPVYNGQDFIADSLSSAINQTLPPNTIIVVNDGSTDKTAVIVKEIAEVSAVKIHFIEQKNLGLSAARNAGITASTAAFVAFLDADDIWLPNKLQKQMEVFQSSVYKNLGVVYCGYENFSDAVGQKSEPPLPPLLKGQVFSNLLTSNTISGSGSSVLIKRSTFDEVGLFNTKMRAFEDWDMWLRLAEKYEFDFTTEVLVKIRKHDSNMQKKYMHMLQNEILFYNTWADRLSSDQVPLQWRRNLETLVFLLAPSLSSIKVIKNNLSQKLFNLYFKKTSGIEFYLLGRTFIKLWKKIWK